MSQTIEQDRRTPDVVRDQQPGTAERRRGVSSATIAIGALVVAVAMIVGIRALTGGSTRATAPFADGNSVEVVLRCTATSCIAGTTDTQGAQWNWITTNGESVPGAWLTADVTGTVKVDSEWGDATFTAGDRSIVVVGGKATPEHTFFG